MKRNLLQGLPAGQEEIIEELCASPAVRIERIVSHGQPSPPGFWYDQNTEEWVLLVQGTATLELENGASERLVTGDYLRIPAHLKHRVAEVSQDAVWLAVHY